MSLLDYKIINNGDSAISIHFKQQSSELLIRQMITIESLIKQQLKCSILELIPSYQSITIIFLPLKLSKKLLIKKIENLLSQPIKASQKESKLIKIPVCYELEFAPDLQSLAQHCKLTTQQVIEKHSQANYLVHMLGFLPGFLYLGGLDPLLACPRKANPEISVPAGSVAIGANQTGIYPVSSPGGWHIIGQTPLRLFNPQEANPVIASPVDRIKFIPISMTDFVAFKKNNQLDPL